MKYDARHASRGQALFETAIAIPIFLISIFGIMWAYRTGVLSEQVQQSVRYGGLVAALADPYESYSLYSVYSTIDNVTPPNARDCVGGTTSIVAQGQSKFWQASSTLSPTPTCGLAILFPSAVKSPVILFSDFVGASAVPQLSGKLGTFVFGNNSISAAQNFFRSPDVGTILNCSNLGTAVKLSLEGATDTTTPTTVPTPFPQTVTPMTSDIIPTSEAVNCYTANANSYLAPTTPY